MSFLACPLVVRFSASPCYMNQSLIHQAPKNFISHHQSSKRANHMQLTVNSLQDFIVSSRQLTWSGECLTRGRPPLLWWILRAGLSLPHVLAMTLTAPDAVTLAVSICDYFTEICFVPSSRLWCLACSVCLLWLAAQPAVSLSHQVKSSLTIYAMSAFSSSYLQQFTQILKMASFRSLPMYIKLTPARQIRTVAFDTMR